VTAQYTNYRPLSHQEPPAGDNWKTWIISGGRGSGKTEAFLQYINSRAIESSVKIAIVAPFMAYFYNIGNRLKMINPDIRSSQRGLTWKNGSIAIFYSVSPAIVSLIRGMEFDIGFAEEVLSWEDESALVALRRAINHGTDPCLLISMGRSPLADIIADPTTQYVVPRVPEGLVSREIEEKLRNLYE
jgi:phage terminase large subunit-like protein